MAVSWGSSCRAGGQHTVHRAPLPSPAAQRPSRRGKALRRAVEEPSSSGGAQEDWREFRARLVQQEVREKTTAPDLSEDQGPSTSTSGADDPQIAGWAHASPLIEQGSVLLSAAGDHFALNQQYFHKAVILIIEHDDTGDIGLILNRPTAYTTDDLDLQMKFVTPGLGGAKGALGGLSSGQVQQGWNIWCGGDCDGLNSAPERQVCFCLHTLESLADVSRQVIRGVFLIDISQAQRIVAEGKADKNDFMLLVGYCGWGKGQMQSELDRGDTWSMAAADQRALLGELREAQLAVRKRQEISGESLRAQDVGDGIAEWRKLYLALGRDFHKRLAQASITGDDGHADDMLHRWIERCLIPRPADAPLTTAAAARVASLQSLKAGSILRASASAWLLGKPAETEDFSPRRFRPAQYLHKGVLIMLSDFEDDESVALALLNGPAVGRLPEGGDVLFGGTSQLGSFSQSVVEVGTGGGASQHVLGSLVLLPGFLAKLVSLGALEVVEGVGLRELLDAPADERWRLAGGRVDTLEQASAAACGDVQRRKWYKRFFGFDPDEDQ